jgi:hypothetical protein
VDDDFPVNDYFNYFTEIEERFCQRRGTAILCSTLDWALMETWKEAGIPLAAVLRGIDAAFDRYDARRSKTRKVNSIAYCAQEVLAAAEEMQEASIGSHRARPASGLELPPIAAYLEGNAAQLESRLAPASATPAGSTPLAAGEGGRRPSAEQKTAALPELAAPVVREAIQTLRDLAGGLKEAKTSPLEDLERRLTVLEERVTGALLAATAGEQLVSMRAEADRELAPYRRKMNAAQLDRLYQQYVHKRLLEQYGVPRLSLFYM